MGKDGEIYGVQVGSYYRMFYFPHQNLEIAFFSDDCFTALITNVREDNAIRAQLIRGSPIYSSEHDGCTHRFYDNRADILHNDGRANHTMTCEQFVSIVEWS